MDRSPSEVLKEIVSLLNSLDGVNVLETMGTMDIFRIELTIESHESHLLLEYCAEAANVHFHCWAAHKPGTEEAISNPARALHYRYHANSRENKTDEAFQDFNLLGACLTWTMYKIGLISGKEEKRLVGIFNAHSRST